MHHPRRNDNLSLNQNSTAFKSTRGLTSNYAVNDNQGSEYEGENLEGTYAFQNFNHFNGNTNEFLEQLQPHVHQSFLDQAENANCGDDQHQTELIPRPDTGNVNFLTESEVRAIVLQFNECLDKHSLEKLELDKRVKQMIDKIDEKQGELIKLFKEKEDLQMENEAIFIKYEQAMTHFKKLLKIRDNFFSIDQSSTPQEEKENRQVNSSSSIQQRLKDLQQRKAKLLGDNIDIRDAIIRKFHEEKVKEKKCVKCKQQFIPLHNQIDSCKFHQGKLKFFSCKGCGADQYYDCCNKCSSCKEKERSKDNMQVDSFSTPRNENSYNHDLSRQTNTEEVKATDYTQVSQLPSERKVGRFHMTQSANFSDSKRQPVTPEVYPYHPQLHHDSDGALTYEGTQRHEAQQRNLLQKLAAEDSPPRLNIHNTDMPNGALHNNGGSIQNISGHLDGMRIALSNNNSHNAAYQNLQASFTIIQVEAELPPFMSETFISVRDNQVTTGFDLRHTLDIANSTIATTQEVGDNISKKGRFRVQERSINNGHFPVGISHDDFHPSSLDHHQELQPSTKSNHNLSTLKIQQNSQDGNHSPSNGGLEVNYSSIYHSDTPQTKSRSLNVGLTKVSPRQEQESLSVKNISSQIQSTTFQRAQTQTETIKKGEDLAQQIQRSPIVEEIETNDFAIEFQGPKVRNKTEFFKIREAPNESSQENTPVRRSRLEEEDQASWNTKRNLEEPTQPTHKVMNRMGSDASLADIEDNMVERRLRQSSGGVGAPSQNPNDQSRNLDDQEQNQIYQKEQEEEFQQEQNDHSNVLNEVQPNKQMNDSQNEADESSAAMAEGNNDDDQASLNAEAEQEALQAEELEKGGDDAFFYPHQQQIISAKKQVYDQELENGYKYSSELRSDKSQRDIESPQNQSQSIDGIKIQINNNKNPQVKEKAQKRPPNKADSNMNLRELVQEQVSHSPYDIINQSLSLQTRKLEWSNEDHVENDHVIKRNFGGNTKRQKGSTLQSVHESLELKSPRDSPNKSKGNQHSPQSQSRQRQFLQNSGYQVNLENSTINMMNNSNPSNYNNADQYQGSRQTFGKQKRGANDTNNEININNATILQSNSNFNNDGDELHISISNMQQIQLIKRSNPDQQRNKNDGHQKIKEMHEEEENSAEKGPRTAKKDSKRKQLNQSKEPFNSQFVFIVGKDGNHKRFSQEELEITKQNKKRFSLRLPTGRRISVVQSALNNEIAGSILKDLNISSSAQIFFTQEMIESEEEVVQPKVEQKRKKSKKNKKPAKKTEERKQVDQQRGQSLTSVRRDENESCKEDDCEQIGRFIIKNSTDDKNDDERPKKNKSRSRHGHCHINQPDLLRMQYPGMFINTRGNNNAMFSHNHLWTDQASPMNSSPMMNQPNFQLMMMNQYMNPHQHQMYPYQSVYQPMGSSMKASQNFDPMRLSASWVNKSTVRPREEIREDQKKKKETSGVLKEDTKQRSSIEKDESESQSDEDLERLQESKDFEKVTFNPSKGKPQKPKLKDFHAAPEGGTLSKEDSPLRQAQGSRSQHTPYFQNQGPPYWHHRQHQQNQELGTFNYQQTLQAQQVMNTYQLQMNSQMQMMDQMMRHQQQMFSSMLNCHQSVMQSALMSSQSHINNRYYDRHQNSSDSSQERSLSNEQLLREARAPKKGAIYSSKQNEKKAAEEELKNQRDRNRRRTAKQQQTYSEEDSSDENIESNQGNSFVNSRGGLRKVQKQKHQEYEQKIKELEKKLQKMKKKRKA